MRAVEVVLADRVASSVVEAVTMHRGIGRQEDVRKLGTYLASKGAGMDTPCWRARKPSVRTTSSGDSSPASRSASARVSTVGSRSLTAGFAFGLFNLGGMAECATRHKHTPGAAKQDDCTLPLGVDSRGGLRAPRSRRRRGKSGEGSKAPAHSKRRATPGRPDTQRPLGTRARLQRARPATT